MSVPRVLLVPTHRTGLANAVAAAAAEVLAKRGMQVRYHHLGPLSPVASWDRWEGTAFIDPAIYSEEALLGLYDVATRGADVSLLSASTGLLDQREGVTWLPKDVARLLDCPVVVLVDCRGWGTGIRLVTAGLRSHLSGLNLAGAVLTGVADREHLELLRAVFAEEGVPVAGCLFAGDGPDWDVTSPGAWGLPLDPDLLEAVARQVDLGGLVALAGQRGFLSSQSWLNDRGIDGPLIAVAGGSGFTPWSRDSIEVLRAAGAQVRRLDLVEDRSLPAGASGLVLAGTLWPAALADIAMNTALLDAIRAGIEGGLPTIALGGGSLLLLDKVQDTLGRTSDLAGVVPVRGEIVWEMEEPLHVGVTARQDNLLLAKGETLTGWMLTDAEVIDPGGRWETPLLVREAGGTGEQGEGVCTDSLLSSRVLMHLAGVSGMAPRFVRRCAEFARSG
ncbi:MAG: hypothetical protein A2133_11240 [Actinobacteria bacterium RBG_16_64_13]|nr:MAG: hypothetical protein A2133_11240 [Actinobacteria bacterium RBG_16_64_13]